MSNLFKVQAVWSGFVGGPGVNTFYVDTDPSDVEAFHDFYDEIKTAFPSYASIQVENSGISIDSEDGSLTGAWGTDPVAAVVGTGEAQSAAGTGAVVRWETGVIIAGRRLYGRTFLVPATRGVYGGDGRLTAGATGAISTAATNLVVACSGTFQVWSRPRPGLVGSGHDVINHVVPARVAELRSRRD